MKKKLLLTFLSVLSVFLLTGCFDTNNLDGSNITTTVYPVEYLVDRLYGEHSDIKSIYPNEIDISKYELTEKGVGINQEINSKFNINATKIFFSVFIPFSFCNNKM